MKKLTALGIGLASFFMLSTQAFADKLTDLCPTNFPGICPEAAGIGGKLGTVINFIFIIAVILAFGFLIYGGIRWITSGGDKGGVENARNTIIAAIVGLIVVFLSYIILNLVLSLFGTTLSGLELPTLKE